MLPTLLPTTPPYRDRKRYAWLLSLVVPCTVGVGPALMAWTGEPLVLWAPVAFFYLPVSYTHLTLPTIYSV